MRNFFRNIRDRWLSVLFVFICIFLLLSFIFFQSFWFNLEINSEAFIPLCGIIATLSGALLGITVATIAFAAQFSINNRNKSMEILSFEMPFIDSTIKADKSDVIEAGNLKDNLIRLRDFCLKASIIIKDNEIEEWFKVYLSTLKFVGGNADMERHMIQVFDAIIRMRMSSMENELSKELVKSAWFSGISLIFSLLFIWLAGITINDKYLLIDPLKTIIAFLLFLFFIISLVFLINIVSLNLKILTSIPTRNG
jgi:hypothetical protein